MIRVFLVDDHQMVLDGISSILEDVENIKVVGTALNGEHAVRALGVEGVDVLLLDINMPEMDGIEVVRQMEKQHIHVNTLILTMHNNPQFTKQLIELGVEGCILKNSGKKELVYAINEVNEGRRYYGEDVTGTLFDSLEKTKKAVDEVLLTKREVEIIKLIATEFTTNEIAEKLMISSFTVDTHRKNIVNKLGVKNIAGLVKFAFEHQLI
ncbi:MAG: DNA-binding response regulator [Cytophagales bacterium CG17_big_fil_post_rev_8_21_14_2_50_40_13]|nr:MAG: DNA-binding response regulator [Cytophagales bacterium CG17_big_fil_post_rev_8_21_14_2_50_40_13]